MIGLRLAEAAFFDGFKNLSFCAQDYALRFHNEAVGRCRRRVFLLRKTTWRLRSASRLTIQALAVCVRSNVSASRRAISPFFLMTIWPAMALHPSLRVRPIIVPSGSYTH